MSDTYVQQSQSHVRTLSRWHSPAAIARMLRITPGSFQNLWRGRLKSIPVYLYMRLCDAVAAELRNEIGRIEHEITLVAAGTRGTRGGEMAAMAAQVAAMRELLEERG